LCCFWDCFLHCFRHTHSNPICYGNCYSNSHTHSFWSRISNSYGNCQYISWLFGVRNRDANFDVYRNLNPYSSSIHDFLGRWNSFGNHHFQLDC
jgi:hypothetical protein